MCDACVCLGLPFHVHGEAWLGLVSGIKLWLLCPPSYALPEDIQRTWDPYEPIEPWILRLLQSYFPVQGQGHGESIAGEGWSVSRGISVVIQRPREVVYVPEGWAHMTYNLPGTRDVVIGVGSQSVWLARDRWDTCIPYLHPISSSYHYDCLKSAVISLLDNVTAATTPDSADALLRTATLYAR